jgi:aconitate hydratase
MENFHQIKQIMKTSSGDVTYFSLTELTKYHPQIKNFPYSLKILLENILRNLMLEKTSKHELENILLWGDKSSFNKEIPFLPSRVVLQDFTGVPVIVDLARSSSSSRI